MTSDSSLGCSLLVLRKRAKTEPGGAPRCGPRRADDQQRRVAPVSQLRSERHSCRGYGRDDSGPRQVLGKCLLSERGTGYRRRCEWVSFQLVSTACADLSSSYPFTLSSFRIACWTSSRNFCFAASLVHDFFTYSSNSLVGLKAF